MSADLGGNDLGGGGVTAHAIGGADHIADTLANFNSKITDATLDDKLDSRPADMHLSYNDRILTKLTSWTVVSDFIFRGTTARGIPTNVKAISHVGDAAESGSIRIYDYTNSQVICTVTGITSLVKAIYDFGALSNLPAGEALFEIQMQTTAGKEFYLRSLMMIF